MSALEDLVDSLTKAADALDDAVSALRSADSDGDTAVERAEAAGLRDGVAMLRSGQEELIGLLTQVTDGQSAVEGFRDRVQALRDEW
jgi:hypothetical protein